MLTQSVVLSYSAVMERCSGGDCGDISKFTPIPAAVRSVSVSARHRHHRAVGLFFGDLSGDARGSIDPIER